MEKWTNTNRHRKWRWIHICKQIYNEITRHNKTGKRSKRTRILDYVQKVRHKLLNKKHDKSPQRNLRTIRHGRWFQTSITSLLQRQNTILNAGKKSVKNQYK